MKKEPVPLAACIRAARSAGGRCAGVVRRAGGACLAAARAVAPLTPRGVFLLALSLAALTDGTLRADMAGLFWGSSFLLAVLYAVLSNHVTRMLISRKRKAPGFLEIRLPSSLLAPGQEESAHLAVALPRAFPPGFVVRCRLPLGWHERRIDGVGAVLSPGPNRRTIPFRPLKRGTYRAEAALLDIRDVIGLTSRTMAETCRESVRVAPAAVPPAVRIRVAESGGEAARYSPRKRQSEELLEVRKYFPGDDVRKLNWKVFAHSNELFLRTGEITPPPESRFLVLLDPTVSPVVPPVLAADYLDGLVEACASALSDLLGRGMDVTFCWPGGPRCRSFTSESRNELLAALADTWWVEAGWRPELPARAGLQTVVFSTPGSPSLPLIMRELSGRGWKVSLVFRDMDTPPDTRAGFRLRNLVLLSADRAGNAPRKAARPEGIGSFKAALGAEASRYGALIAGGMGSDARR